MSVLVLRNLFFLTIIICSIGCTTESTSAIDQNLIARHMAELSSDAYMGRMPCTEGESKTIAYLQSEMQRMGLKTANESYLQEVPLIDITSSFSEFMDISTKSGIIELEASKDFVVHTERKINQISLDQSELVFCGYGMVSEKDGWNDYADLDMKGKTAVVLVNDPGFGGEDSTFFKGDIMTYFGRWTYKYDEADIQGADGLLIIHETTSAGYPWTVVQNSWTGSQQGLAGIDRSEDCGVKGWITLDAAQRLFEACDMDLPALIRAARKPGFKPVPMNANVSVDISVDYNECLSNNVFGYIEGSQRPDEIIMYTAHWDHIGVGRVIEGDSIYNGALDNASGTSTVLAIADALSNEKPERSIGFLFVTAEEQGLLGSEYYAANPIFPLEKTVANLNLDGVNPAGMMKDLTIVGIGHSTMDVVAQEAATDQDRYIIAESEPEKGFFFRSDQFNFAKKGVPVLYAQGGYEHAEKGIEYAKSFKEEYTAKRYHAPSDQYDPATWNFEGMLQDGELYYNISMKLANSDVWPQWYPESEFSRPKSNLKD